MYKIDLENRRYNSMARGIIDNVVNLRKNIIKDSLYNIHDDEHRFHIVATVRGVDYINDSGATNINATWYSLEKLYGNVILILDGRVKHEDFYLIYDLIKKKVKILVCIGDENNSSISKVENLNNVIYVDDISEAVKVAYVLSKRDDIVLFSPGFPSFGMYDNYIQRGNVFINEVLNL